MGSLDLLKNSPAQQLLKQLEIPLAIAHKTALQVDGIYDSEAVVAATKVVHQDWMKDLSSVATSWRKELQTRGLQPTPIEKAIESLKKNLAAEAASMVAGWETSLAASAFEDSHTQRVLEAMKRDCDPIAKAMKSAQEKWTTESEGIAKITEGFRHYLARESAILGAVWKPVEAARVLDPMNVLDKLDLPSMAAIDQASAWASPIFLKQLEVPMLPKKRADNIVGRRSFRNYRMAEAFDLLSDFERDLRDFIHDAMLEVFGGVLPRFHGQLS